MSGRGSEQRGIRGRHVFEILLVAIIAYFAFQVGPAVKQRIDFLNEMQVAANSPIEKTSDQIRVELRAVAESMGIVIHSEHLFVERNTTEGITTITADYQIHINFWPNYTYVWNVKDQVEGYLL
jgi:hypothetical protein